MEIKHFIMIYNVWVDMKPCCERIWDVEERIHLEPVLTLSTLNVAACPQQFPFWD